MVRRGGLLAGLEMEWRVSLSGNIRHCLALLQSFLRLTKTFIPFFEFLIALRLSCIYTDAMPAPWNPAP
jgi:hypothetical protein